MTKQKLEELTGKFCDKYCIYARMYSSEEQQDKLDEICESCPMNEMFELLDILPDGNSVVKISAPAPIPETACSSDVSNSGGWIAAFMRTFLGR